MPAMLDAGISPNQFYSMTLVEMKKVLESYKRQKKQHCLDIYIGSVLTTRGVASILSKDAEMPTIEEVWGPEMFSDNPESEGMESIDLAKMHSDFQMDLIRVEMDALKE